MAIDMEALTPEDESDPGGSVWGISRRSKDAANGCSILVLSIKFKII
jgi:hypothetical protein